MSAPGPTQPAPKIGKHWHTIMRMFAACAREDARRIATLEAKLSAALAQVKLLREALESIRKMAQPTSVGFGAVDIEQRASVALAGARRPTPESL
jgi:hypothetical protein